MTAVLLLGACATPHASTPAAPPAARAEPLQFIHDDYEGALARARAQDVPLFVDVWTTW